MRRRGCRQELSKDSLAGANGSTGFVQLVDMLDLSNARLLYLNTPERHVSCNTHTHTCFPCAL